MKGISTVTVRTFAVVLAVTLIVVISSYFYLDAQGSPRLSDCNQYSASHQQQATTQSIQSSVIYNFGNHYFEPPSAILISPNTLVWTNFKFDNNSNFYVESGFELYPFSDLSGANITVAAYLNGNLVANDTTTMLAGNYAVVNSSLKPSSSSPNSIFSLTGVMTGVGEGTETTTAINLNGTTMSFAIVSDSPIWIAGWTQNDMSKGTGPQFGASAGQLAETCETPESSASLPNSLPQATMSLTFELQVLGGLMA